MIGSSQWRISGEWTQQMVVLWQTLEGRADGRKQTSGVVMAEKGVSHVTCLLPVRCKVSSLHHLRPVTMALTDQRLKLARETLPLLNHSSQTLSQR